MKKVLIVIVLISCAFFVKAFDLTAEHLEKIMLEQDTYCKENKPFKDFDTPEGKKSAVYVCSVAYDNNDRLVSIIQWQNISKYTLLCSIEYSPYTGDVIRIKGSCPGFVSEFEYVTISSFKYTKNTVSEINAFFGVFSKVYKGLATLYRDGASVVEVEGEEILTIYSYYMLMTLDYILEGEE